MTGPTDSPLPGSAHTQGQLTPLREMQLVEAHRKGGASAHDALAELLEAYQRRIFSICARMVRNQDDAADLTQDVLIKVIEGLGSYNGRSQLSTWIIRVTMNCCLSHLRKQKLRAHESMEGLEGGKRGAITRPGTAHAGGSGVRTAEFGRRSGDQGMEPLPQQGVEQAQVRSMVLQALDSLDAETRAILVLRDLQDLDYQQLAEVFQVPVGTVKSRLFRARAALRAAIEARGGM
jgi:RNA polymerase sigma-70 factor (ECF subfamily)